MTNEERKAELIDGVIAMIQARLPAAQAEPLTGFVARYFQQVDADDLNERSIGDLYGAALAHWHFGHRFISGVPRVRVYNPNVQEHGWQSPHTVVEIVNDDMPFLVDSVAVEINRQGFTLHLTIHPVLCIERDAEGLLLSLAEHGSPAARMDSFIHLEVDRRTDPQALEALATGLARILGDVRAAVADWQPLLQKISEVMTETEQRPAPQDAEQSAEDRAFLQWLADGHFTLLGYRNYDLLEKGGEDVLRVVPDSGLGILRGSTDVVSASFALLPPELRAQAREPRLLVLAKSNARATVHRPAYLDYVGVKRFDDAGCVIGEHRFLGLFTSTAYSARPVDIPLLRLKVAKVCQHAAFAPNSHGAKALATILEQYPRDELFQISEDELFANAMGVLRLGERQRSRLFVRRDAYGRFFACLVFVPRERYNTELRGRIQHILETALNGSSSEFSVQISESVLARILITVRTDPGSVAEFDVRELEARVARASHRWEDDLAQALIEHCGEEEGVRRRLCYAEGFPVAYREDVAARSAVPDIDLMESMAAAGGIAVSLYLPLEAPEGTLRFKIFKEGGPVALSDSLPMLENMGVKVMEERPYRVLRANAADVWIHDFGLARADARELPLAQLRPLFHEAFLRVWRGEMENDGLNRLVLAAALDWHQVKVLRAYARYMRQSGVTFSQKYIESTLSAHAGIAAMLAALFAARFDPAREGGREARMRQQSDAIVAALEKVDNLDEDRILRQFLALIEATLRTNFYRRDGAPDPKPYFSFKFDPKRVPGLPEPRPMFEIFVFSPRFEGVHLRGGYVARGGLRWSDRMEDYRTEVLGLVKAQMVKNAVIVPVGSKGGFVLKKAPTGDDRDTLTKEAIACYQTYLRGMLDITDNLAGGRIVPPPDTVRHDGDDAYLVVAADKGTATFSDHANAVAREYGFWLDDAFASGGSAGYDHKKMGITARGAWESVKSHFAGMGHDTQSQDFTVVGVGDMSGDVFGNGMLLSRHIRLLAAFDHRHIFIDPQADAAAGFAERERLFALPRSSWADYDRSLISTGGGVWPRQAKSIAVSPEAAAALGIASGALTPAELIRAIVKAPADLLYNGGIGTYVKAEDESHAQVGDKANDAIRVNGCELRVRVVAEGGNLGFTQRGRIEFAAAGGHIYTDAIDNSAGVDCSDHEVNIKILLNAVVADGEMTRKQRDQLLAAMTDEVAALVLRDNREQTRVIAAMAAQSAELLDEHARYMRHLEKAGRLSRAIEFLPDEEEIAARRLARRGLAAPELAVLLAYGKMELYDALLVSDLPEDPLAGPALLGYFPRPLTERLGDAIAGHPLKREIAATRIANELVNRVGPSFIHRLTEDAGAGVADVVRAFMLVRDTYGLEAVWSAIEALGPQVPAATRIALQVDVDRLITRAAHWFLRHPVTLRDLAGTVERFAAALTGLAQALPDLLMDVERAALDAAVGRYAGDQVPEDLARQVVGLYPLYAALDVTEIAADAARGPLETAAVYFGLVGRLELLWLNQQIIALPVESHWQLLARDALRDDLSGIAAAITAWVFKSSAPGCDVPTLIGAWEQARQQSLRRYRQVVGELRQAPSLDMPMVSVALRELRALVRA